MSNQELLLQIHKYLHQVNFFYSTVIDTCDRHQIEKILDLKKKLGIISALKPSRYPIHILIIQQELKQVLPSKKYPVYFEYSKQLEELFTCCRENLKSTINA